MNRYLILTKVMLKSIDLGITRGGFKNKKNLKSIALTILILICFLPLGVSIGVAIFSAYDVLAQIHQEGVILGLGLTIVSLAIFFFGIFYIINVFYFSKDIESLLPLPLRPSEILGAKFTITLIYEFLTELLFLLPILIAFGIKSHGGILYYLYALLVFVLLPVAPMVYAAILSMIIMRYTNIGRHKDRFKIIGGIVAMFFGIGVNIAVQRLSGPSGGAEQIQKLAMQGNNSLLSTTSQLFPQNKYAAMGMVYSNQIQGLLNLILFVAIIAVFVIVFLYIGEKLYFKGVVGVSEAVSKRKRISRQVFDKIVVQKPVMYTLVMRELRLLFRTPIYFLNCILMNFLWPVFLIIPMFVQPEAAEQIKGLAQYVNDSGVTGILLVAAFGISTFVTASSLITPTAISREGRNIYINKFIPVRYSTQIMAKVLSGVAMGIVGAGTMVIAALIFIPMPLYLLLMITIVSLLGIFFSALSGILIDLYFPKLLWENEQKAVKQNTNGVIHIFLCAATAGIVVFISIQMHLGLWAVFTGLIVLFGLLDIILYGLVAFLGSKLFGKIEV